VERSANSSQIQRVEALFVEFFPYESMGCPAPSLRSCSAQLLRGNKITIKT
jgi:hypothetical protein